MCGIVGVVTGTNNQYQLNEIVNKMAKEITHRGPDYSGIYFDEDLSFCFAHQRLSILDLSKNGNQPMHSYRDRYVISFNGEIYNFRDLRKKLDIETNINWRGHSDTEVLINGIEYWGLQKTLDLSKGMFAFALLDKKTKKLFLVRDRFGEKPLYWGFNGNGSSQALVFGSEIAALKEFPSFEQELDKCAINAFMKFSCIPSDLTIYKSIKKIKPGHISEFDLKNDSEISPPKIYKWWDYKRIINSGSKEKFKSEKEALFYLEESLKNATKACLISDVPVGCFLSGGIDSSLIASLLSQQTNSKINTFTIGFEDENYDESLDAKKVSDFLGTNHEEIILKPDDALNLIPELPSIYSEPFADPSQIPTALLCREIKKKGIDVALTGDGGDEIFGGYFRHFKGALTWSRIKLIPYPLRSSLGAFIKSIPPNQFKKLDFISKKHNFAQKALKVATRLNNIKSSDDLYRSLYMENIDSAIYSKSFINEFNTPFESYYSELNHSPSCLKNDPTARMLYWDAISYLPDDILVKVDRASMAYSLETRAPFLDKNLVDLAWKIPTKMKVNNGQGKIILKKLLCKYLPKEYVYRPKQGFGIPIEDWIRGPLKEWSEELLLGNSIRNQNIFSSERIKIIWDDHLNKNVDNTNILFSILMLQSWLNFQK